jgi:hypothetical protein
VSDERSGDAGCEPSSEGVSDEWSGDAADAPASGGERDERSGDAGCGGDGGAPRAAAVAALLPMPKKPNMEVKSLASRRAATQLGPRSAVKFTG